MKKSMILSALSILCAAAMVSCGSVENETAEVKTDSFTSAEQSVKPVVAEETKSTDLNEKEQDIYKTIKEQLPLMQETVPDINITECTVSSPVYVFDCNSGEMESKPHFYLIYDGDIIASIDINEDSDGKREVSLTWGDEEKELNRLLENGREFVKLAGRPLPSVQSDEVTFDGGLPYYGYYYDGEFYIDGIGKDNFDSSSVDKSKLVLRPICDMGEKVKDMTV